jgi:hypothetical protein
MPPADAPGRPAEPGLAVRPFQLPAVGHAVGEAQRRLAAWLELGERGTAGVQLEPAHREAAAHVRLDAHVGAEPPAELLRLGHRVEHLLRCRVDHHGRVQLGRREVALGRQLAAGQVVGQVSDSQRPERRQRSTGAGRVCQHLRDAGQVALAQRHQRAVCVFNELPQVAGRFLWRFGSVGFPDGEAAELSSLHTRNFM